MPVRTTSRQVTFARPFRLGSDVDEQPAGTYTVETDEEQLDAASVIAFRRIATWIRLPLPGRAAGGSQNVMIDPGTLDAALLRDAAPETYGPEPAAAYNARR